MGLVFQAATKDTVQTVDDRIECPVLYQETPDGEWCYKESLGNPVTVTLVGGGHVALALSPILKTLDMRVVVLDDRMNLATMQANTAADEKRLVAYRDIRSHIPSGIRSFVCIMTFGHKNDELVLRQLVEYPLGYLGMMGSKAKNRQLMQSLRESGISEQALSVVHAPIGLPIKSNTPQEIAISIAAELIAVRADLTQS